MKNARSFGAHLVSLDACRKTDDGQSCPLFVRVRFEVRVETLYGDTVAVVGNVPDMGAWQPTEALRMYTMEQIYPIWRCEPLLLSSEAGEIEYKFLVISAGGAVRWEPLLHNRRLLLEGGEAQVIADWGSPSAMPSAVSSIDAFGRPVGSGPLSRVSSVSQATPLGSPLPAARSACNVCFAEDLTPSPAASTPAIRPEAPRASAPESLEAVSGAKTHLGERSNSLVERLLVVQQYLPFNVCRGEDGSWTGTWDEWALLATPAQGGRHLMGSLNIEVIFVGTVRQSVPPEAQAEVRDLLRQHNCVPVYMDPKLQECHRNGYAPLVLWPLLHNQIPDRHAGGKGGDGSRVASLFTSYTRANDDFAAVVRTLLRPGDMVWIHSYPLLLLPKALRSGRIPKNVIISLFLHSPFPSPEVWRVLPHRAELLSGMLASHVVGFHLFEYARHFMTSCRRLLGLGENVGAGPAGGVLSIDMGSRCVTITVSHVGIDRDIICHRLRLPDTAGFEEQLRARCGGGSRTIIGGVEMLNPLQGSTLKLQAYELLLQNYPIWRRSVTMVQVCFADPARPEESASQSAENRAAVEAIQEQFGAESIHYLEVGREIALSDWSVNFRLGLFRLFDVLMSCATKDGLNLLPFEFVLTKSMQEASGVVVLSEFVGCSHVLNGGVRVNPFYLEQVVEQLDTALSMPNNERVARLAKDYKFVSENTTTSWLHVAVQDMRRVRSHAAAMATPTNATRAIVASGSELQVGQPLPLLNTETLVRTYRQCTRRLILLGLDGTLIQQEKVIAHLKNFQDFQGHTLSPPPAALHCLRALCADPLNVVVVVSGRSAADMEACLGDIEGLGLAAELGFLRRPPGQLHWVHRELTAAQANWRELAKPVLDRFTTRTNGAYLRWQESAALWCYQNADPDFGRFQAHQLTISLRERLKGAGVCVSNSLAKGQVEVRVAGVNKGALADDIFCATQRQAPVDFVLCIGDDDDDEYMLSAVTARSSSAEMRERLQRRLFTVSVGNKDFSHAGFTVDNSRDVLGLLETLRTVAG